MLIPLPFITSGYVVSLASLVLVYIVLAQSYNVFTGWTRYVSFGHHGFIGIGAYVSAISIVKFGAPIFLGSIFGGISAMAISIPLSYSTLRFIRGAYFSILSFCLALVAQLTVYMFPTITGAGTGYVLKPIDYSKEYYFAGLITTFILAFIILRIRRTPFYLAAVAVKEDEFAAGGMGNNTFKCKMVALMISSIFPGLVGGSWAWYMTMIEPIGAFDVVWTVNSMIMILLGGIGTFVGPIIGAIGLVLLWEVLNTWTPLLYLVAVGIIIIVIISFFPQGIYGFLKKYFPNIF